MTTTRSKEPFGFPTTYRSTRFRSRLEARWAAFFDLVGWSWVYEPFDTEGWLPDFLITSRFPFLVEVGPCITREEFFDKASKALAAFPPREVGDSETGHLEPPERITLVLGAGPLAIADGDADYNDAGYLTDDGHASGPDWALWGKCWECDRLGIYHDSGDRTMLRPCGHRNHRSATERSLFDAWAAAGDKVQWRPRRAA